MLRPDERAARLGFFGRRLVGLMLDGSHHGEAEHDERDVTMPAVPGSGFVVVEPELVFGCLEAILDRPAMALDADQGLDRSPCRTPGGEVGEIAVGASMNTSSQSVNEVATVRIRAAAHRPADLAPSRSADLNYELMSCRSNTASAASRTGAMPRKPFSPRTNNGYRSSNRFTSRARKRASMRASNDR